MPEPRVFQGIRDTRNHLAIPDNALYTSRQPPCIPAIDGGFAIRLPRDYIDKP
jgi:hypothetical protein